MLRSSGALLLTIVALSGTARADGFVPAPAETVSGYFAQPMPCRIERDPDIERTIVTCKGELLEKKTLRELAILRNTIFARYGWGGFRKVWLREHFEKQPWFKVNPKFSYRQLSEADRKNAHFIAVREHAFTLTDLEMHKQDLLEKGEKNLSPEDRIELGLLARAMGQFALDDDKREKSESRSLDQLLRVDELRKLSLRDLRLLRNTIYARRGRPFKSQILQDHFKGMGWYKIDPAYSDRLLSKTDTRNISLIKSVENEFGGPMTDDDWLQEPAIDGA
jgi:hypothetical protein